MAGRRRNGHRGSHRQRRRDRHAHAQRLHQAHDVSAYRAQRRGGKGVIGMTAREAENGSRQRLRRVALHGDHARLPDVLHAERTLLRGTRVRNSRRIPRQQGRSIANFLELRSEEKIAATIRIQGQKTDEETFNNQLHVVFATKSGIVKKSNLNDFKNIRKGGIIAIQIEERRSRSSTANSPAASTISSSSPIEGMSIRFNEEELRDQGRNTVGVWGIRPDAG